VRLALQQQPQLTAAASTVQAAGENAVAAGSLPDPKLNFGVVNLPTDTFDFDQEAMTQALVGISQTFPGGRKRTLASERLRAEQAQGEAQLSVLRRRIARDTALAWLARYLPEHARTLVQKLQGEYELQAGVANIAYETGRQQRDEALAVHLMREQTTDRLSELERQRLRARAGLARWIGAAAERPLAAELPELPPPEAADIAAVIGRHPELAALRSAQESSSADVALAREAYKPDWTIFAGYGVRDSRPDFLSLTLGLDLPLFTENRQDRRLNARLAEGTRAAETLEDRRRALKADAETAAAEWRVADARIRHYRDTILPLARDRIENALAAYQTDRAGFGRVLDARRADLEARLQLLNLEVARLRAALEWRYLLADEVLP
jgi:outer membrane protein TolC